MKRASSIKRCLPLQPPKHVLYWDTETVYEEIGDLQYHNLRCGSYIFYEFVNDDHYEERARGVFFTPEEFADQLTSIAEDIGVLWCFAANVPFELILLQLHRMLADRSYIVSLPVEKGLSFFLTAHKRSGKRTIMHFIDVLGLSRGSVADIGRAIGLPKLSMPSPDDPDSAWYEYNFRDTEIIAIFINRFIETLYHTFGTSIDHTIATTAFKLYRYRFMPKPIPLHNNEDVLRLERAGYLGGRCEAFRIGKCPDQLYYYLDVNSMYPFVMLNQLYPFRLRGYIEHPLYQQLKWALRDRIAIADVIVECESPRYPVRSATKLIFPVGCFRTTLAHSELRTAFERDEIRDVISLAIYEPLDLFSNYVNTLYDLRLRYRNEGNNPASYSVKLLLNSLYGKFGQTGHHRRKIKNNESNEILVQYGINGDTHQPCRIVYWLDGVYEEWQEGESFYSFPAIAACVTSAARDYLANLIDLAGQDHVYYCDTDSLIVDQTGYEKLQHLIDPTTLGALKLEGITSDLHIYAAKMYRFGEEEKKKGIPKNAREIDPFVFEYVQFPGFLEWLKECAPGQLEATIIRKTAIPTYDKRYVNSDGSTEPIRLVDGYDLLKPASRQARTAPHQPASPQAPARLAR